MPLPAVYLSRKEVAELLGYQPDTMNNLDFAWPTPDARIGRVRGWKRETIEKWFASGQIRRPRKQAG